jgi:hypothetical protein
VPAVRLTKNKIKEERQLLFGKAKEIVEGKKPRRDVISRIGKKRVCAIRGHDFEKPVQRRVLFFSHKKN